MSLPFKYKVGLEVHVELATKTKMFCRCKNDPFFSGPNENTCPVCLGLPGTLPVPNSEAVKRTIIAGKALNCEIAKLSKWDRKHYFYPDLPKGYQISQYDMPLCEGGHLDLLDEKGEIKSTIRLNRIHLEEDAGKLQHSGKISKVDLNRAGVPLMEMVTEPDITSPEEARAFMMELRLLMRTLGISEADMEKGQMRCDVNINIIFEEDGKVVKTPITEVKNVNSTRAVERAVFYEGQRQYDEWMADGAIKKRKNKITVGWDEDKGEINLQRAKEEANEYRYFPEPDIPPIAVYEIDDLNPANVALPELPNQKRKRYLELGIQSADVELLINDVPRRDYFENCLEASLNAKSAANWIVNSPEVVELEVSKLLELLNLIESGSVAAAGAKASIVEIVKGANEGREISEVAQKLGLISEHDEKAVLDAISKVFAEQNKAVEDYKSGNEKILGFLVGQVMKQVGKKGQPAKVQEAVKKELSK